MSKATELTTPAPAATSATGTPLAGWLAVISVAVGIFSVVTSEMLPVGLLTSIGTDLDVSDGTAGLAVTVPGLVAAVSAPLVTTAVGRLDRRLVLCGLMALLATANLLSAFAPGFAVLLTARVLVGVSIGGVWSIAGGLAVRLVPERSVGTATALIFSGIAVASVLGVPAGTLIGDLADWRTAFAVVGVLALAVLIALACLLPPLPATGTVRLGEVPGLLRNPRLRSVLAVTLLLVTGHFGAYTYVRPVLEDVSGVGTGLISTLLLVYGLAGITGNFVAGAAAQRDARRTALALSALLAAAELALPLLGRGPVGATALLLLWGVAYGGVSVTTQTWVTDAAPHTREAASALFVGAFNVAIALGALLGGQVADRTTLSGVLWCGGALAVLALLTAALSGRGDRTSKDPAAGSAAGSA
ncbi:MFS transporter [Streptomyces palmae]|uniref:MFS transporter n=1 Tax=Streptomyces palmae TaxID=1701085 RepID=A0A4Z0HEN3_9ACTN|nr:MFS transporter [Streptomyces palmae]TGB17952.1 MFS transporter [Streptomyces palmae]